MKRLLLLALPFLVITLYSCSKDSDGKDPDSGDNEPSQSEKLVRTISTKDVNGDTERITFTYDNQGRITETVWYDDEMTLFTYVDNKITVNDDGYIVYFTLDGNGYLTQMDDGEGLYVRHDYSNGYASETTVQSDYYGTEDAEITYTWRNGNLVELHETNKWGGRSEYLTYNNIENKLNLNLLDFVTDDIEWANTYTGINFKGRYPKNYPISIRDEDGFEMSLSYTFDNDNYPTKIVVIEGDGDGYTVSLTYY